jgi:hypothetical protein
MRLVMPHTLKAGQSSHQAEYKYAVAIRLFYAAQACLSTDDQKGLTAILARVVVCLDQLPLIY